MKKITLNVEGITQKQWSNFVLELNIMRKAWKPYGVDVKLLGHGVKKIVEISAHLPEEPTLLQTLDFSEFFKR